MTGWGIFSAINGEFSLTITLMGAQAKLELIEAETIRLAAQETGM